MAEKWRKLRNNMKHSAILFGFVVSLGMVAGCNKGGDEPVTSTTTTTPGKTAVASNSSVPLPAGWKLAEAKADKISMGIAPDWRAIDLTEGDWSKMADIAFKDDPKAAEKRGMIEAIAKNKTMKMMVMHQLDAQNFTSNINVIAMPSGGKSLDEIVKLNGDQLQQMYNISAKAEPIKLAGGDASVMKFQVTQGANKLAEECYITVKGDTYYIVTVTLPASASEALVKEAEQMAQTFNVGA